MLLSSGIVLIDLRFDRFVENWNHRINNDGDDDSHLSPWCG